jgi:hypothetical protein
MNIPEKQLGKISYVNIEIPESESWAYKNILIEIKTYANSYNEETKSSKITLIANIVHCDERGIWIKNFLHKDKLGPIFSYIPESLIKTVHIFDNSPTASDHHKLGFVPPFATESQQFLDVTDKS